MIVRVFTPPDLPYRPALRRQHTVNRYATLGLSLALPAAASQTAEPGLTVLSGISVLSTVVQAMTGAPLAVSTGSSLGIASLQAGQSNRLSPLSTIMSGAVSQGTIDVPLISLALSLLDAATVRDTTMRQTRVAQCLVALAVTMDALGAVYTSEQLIRLVDELMAQPGIIAESWSQESH